jgi:hypothetical protein
MHNFIGISNKVDNFRKGFFTDPYDEPTFLTFAIDFNFSDSNPILQDYHLWNSPLFSEQEDGSINYLTRIGYSNQANGMKVFKEIFRYLTFDAPWYFQSIGGLNQLWAGATNVESGQKTKGVSLTIETLEAIDLRITQLASLYRDAIYDKTFLRERVPDNLRWFSMDIYIAEARNIRYRLPGLGQGIANTFGVNTASIGNIMGGGNLVSNVLEQYGFVKFKCRQCEFDFSESFAAGTKVDVKTQKEQSTNSFKINVGFFEEESRFSDGTQLYDDPIKTEINNPWGIKQLGADLRNAASFLSGLPVIGDDIERAGASVQNALASVGGLINPALEAASRLVDPPVTDLGNVYGN